ncbi:MAG: SigE family RNA polymerase sigma factor [Actinomycetota bacterium]|nr:SigE family RNA polymerase sigma factor [Actinomycetota bacterium]
MVDRRGGTVDANEFDEFYQASFPRLVGQLSVMTGNLAEAQDCVQEAFVRAWLHRSSLSTVGSPDAWVRTVAWRLAVSRWRRAKQALGFRHRTAAPQVVAGPSLDRPALVAALAQLPAEQRRAIVLHLHHLCDLSVADVAAETGVPVGTVKARLSRGRTALASLLTDHSTEVAHHD